MKRSALSCPAAVVIVAVLGCDRPGEAEKFKDRGSGPPVATQRENSVERLKENAAQLYGQRVTLDGALLRSRPGARVFTLRDVGLSPERMTVLTRSPVVLGGTAFTDDAHVIVTGTVRRFVAPELERDLGWDIPPDLERELHDKPVLVADEIRRIDAPGATWSEPRGPS